MKAGPRSTRQRSIVVIGAFLYLWVMVAVALTTLSLLGPVAWVTGRTGWAGWPYGARTLGFLLMLLVSFLLSRWLLRRTLLSRSSMMRVVIPAAVTLVALAGAWAWLVTAEAPVGPDVSEVVSESDSADVLLRAGRLVTDERLLLEESA